MGIRLMGSCFMGGYKVGAMEAVSQFESRIDLTRNKQSTSCFLLVLE